jgi:hypothetical protein
VGGDDRLGDGGVKGLFFGGDHCALKRHAMLLSGREGAV